MLGPESVRSFVVGGPDRGMTTMGWASVGVLELSALPTTGRERWEPWVREADVLLVDGGDATYLCHWMRESGLADLLPDLDTVWAGLSAGSMVMTPRIGEDFVSRARHHDDAADRRGLRGVAGLRTTGRWASSTSRSSRTSATR